MKAALKNLDKTNPKEYLKGIIHATLTRSTPLSYSVKELNKKNKTIRLAYSKLDYKNYKPQSFIEEIKFDEEDITKNNPFPNTSTIKKSFYIEEKNIRIDFSIEKDKDISVDRIYFWHNDELIHTLNLEELKIKNIYYDNNFGCPNINNAQNKIVFIAEEKKEHTKRADFTGVNDLVLINDTEVDSKDKGEKSKENEVKKDSKYNKFDYEQSFGESMYNMFLPEMFVLDFNYVFYNQVSVKKVNISKLNTEVMEKENCKVYPALPCFDYNDNVVFVGYHLLFKLGLKYCHKRRSDIYLIIKDTINNKEKEVSVDLNINIFNLNTESKTYANMFPSVSNKNELIYLSTEQCVPHMNGYQIRKLSYEFKDYDPKSTNKILLKDEVVMDKVINNNKYFNGVYGYCVNICKNAIFKNQFYIFGSIINSKEQVYCLDFVNNILLNVSNICEYEELKYPNQNIIYCSESKDNDRSRNNDNEYESNSNYEELSFKEYIVIQKASPSNLIEVDVLTFDIDKYNSCVNQIKSKALKNSFDSNEKIRFLEDRELISFFITKRTITKNNTLMKSCLSLKNMQLLEEDFESIVKLRKENNKDKSNDINNDADNKNDSYLKWSDSNIFKTHISDILSKTTVEFISDNTSYGYLMKLKENKESTKDLLASKDKPKRKLLYLLHGGPNSSYNQHYSSLNTILLASGFDILACNYPGSSGYGSKYLSDLNGRIGDLDVSSIGNFLSEFLKKHDYDENQIFAFGGSHGGYLSAWMTVDTRFNHLFKANIIFNPVIDVYALYTTSDIKDWSYELPTNKFLDFTVSEETMLEMRKKSPITYAKDAKCPALLLIGGKDRRVTPENNGVQFYHALRHYKKDVQMKYFPEDDHPISSPESSHEVIYSICDFLVENRVKI